jgi:nucleotide-binding universal stress UspA family protein
MKTIAVGIDFTDVKDKVIEAAVSLARAFEGTLHLVHVCAPEPALVGYSGYTYPGIDEREHELQVEKEELRKIVDGLKAEGLAVHGYMKSDETEKGLIEFAEHRNAEVLVIGTHSRNLLSRVLLGSVAEGVVRKCPIPVLVVPNSEKPA